MTSDGAQGLTTGRSYWVVIGATTVLWLAHLVGMAVLAESGCVGWGVGVLHWFTVGLFLPTAALGWFAWRRERAGEDEGFLAALALAVAVVNAFAIVAEWVPVVFLAACAG